MVIGVYVWGHWWRHYQSPYNIRTCRPIVSGLGFCRKDFWPIRLHYLHLLLSKGDVPFSVRFIIYL